MPNYIETVFYIFSDHDRAHPPKIGTIITYRFQELTNDGIPRFPSYVGKLCVFVKDLRGYLKFFTQ